MAQDQRVPDDYLRLYSEAKMTRKEIERLLDAPLGFGELLRELQERDLPLPRIPSDPDKVGLVKGLILDKRGDAHDG